MEDAATDLYADPAEPALPDGGMVLDTKRTALVITDPQIDFLSEKGVTWGGRWRQRHRKQYRRKYWPLVQSRQGRRHDRGDLPALLLPH